ncbi:MAG: hypothetical protein A3A33_02255 [Candidatus Yanofskybacteria bacterium RIFCSPLOWO2_01_FULL_49_25]|uniref:DUF5666 domain-containing protein n=1 Tax=Candidatus Yanofskybacteria bacterium RIFCSPLOWO2_01_FULL_49_25 TaxID=1802701 RepID=A0A1F8GRW1_9BACT|nr:MAG: hypothetical protein A3A33_02255 [Candidatus Yanofskybacteria bacterium RIFCSPLOWO2_01_FULL_49_25]
MSKIITAVLVVIVGFGAFFGGSAYANNKAATTRQARIGAAGGFGAGRGVAGGTGGIEGMNAGGFSNGDIIAKDATSITIKMRDGSSKIVFYSGTTEVGKFVSGNTDDLAVGKTVTITGKANTDGSITAKSIQVRPSMPSPSATPAIAR